MFITSNQVNHNDIANALMRWSMARWHILQRNTDPVRIEASITSLYNTIVSEFQKNFPLTSKQPAQFEKMCNLAARIAYGTP